MSKSPQEQATHGNDAASSDLTTGRLNVALFDPSVFPDDGGLREQMLAWFRADTPSRVILTHRMNLLLAEKRDATLGGLLRRVFSSMLRGEGFDFSPVSALAAFLVKENVMSQEEIQNAREIIEQNAPSVPAVPAPAQSATVKKLDEARAAFVKAGEILSEVKK